MPEYWVFDVEQRMIYKVGAPNGNAYSERRELAFGERIETSMVEGLAVETLGI